MSKREGPGSLHPSGDRVRPSSPCQCCGTLLTSTLDSTVLFCPVKSLVSEHNGDLEWSVLPSSGDPGETVSTHEEHEGEDTSPIPFVRKDDGEDPGFPFDPLTPLVHPSYLT